LRFDLRQYRRFAFVFIFGVIAYLLMNLFVFKVWTEDILTWNNQHNGDEARLGYITGSAYDKLLVSPTPKRHIETYEYKGQPVDVLTFGDSFSNGYGGSFYQDWIASVDNFSVMNVRTFRGKGRSSLDTMLIILNSGYIDKIKPRYVILEVLERNIVEWGSVDIDFTITADRKEIDAELFRGPAKDQLPEVKFVNEGNMKFLLYSLLYKFSDNAFFSKTC